MKRTIIYPLLLFLSISFTGKADVWTKPAVKEYYSQNKTYKFVVYPSVTPDKYEEWHKYRIIDSKLSKAEQKKKERFFSDLTASDTVLVPCTGILYHISGDDTVKIWERKLLNAVCPVNANVSDDGSSVVTFDNWYSNGYGMNVMVVYNGKGDAKRTYKLEEITPYPLNDYFTSISSIWWDAGTRFIDKDRIEISFQNEKHVVKKRIYNTKEYAFEDRQ